MLTTAERTSDGVRLTGGAPEPLSGVTISSTPGCVELRRHRPGSGPVLFRMGQDRLEWSRRLEDFGAPADLDAGSLLALVHGVPLPPDASGVAGVRRLRVGSGVRIDADGVTLTRPGPDAQPDRGSHQPDLVRAVGDELGALGSYAVAWGGGLGSSFVLACALDAGHQPTVLHADLGLGSLLTHGRDEVAGLDVTRIDLDLETIWHETQVTGTEPTPPMPDALLRQTRLDAVAATAEARGERVVTGALVEALTAVKLPEVDLGRGERRLRSCEPFHLGGTLADLDAARAALGRGGAPVVREGAAREARTRAESPPPGQTAGDEVPGLTEAGREALVSARMGSSALWQDHLAALGPVVGRAEAALEEVAVADEHAFPVLSAGVGAALASFPPARLGRIAGGRLETHLPLRAAVARHGITPAERSGAFVLRLAAATHLHAHREDLVAELRAGSALADRGLVDVDQLVRLLRDAELATYAPVVLRTIWLDRWLRRRP